ncbi:MAG: cellulose binding domain-containing protein, partial [Bacteroidales bacterium]|nr:cellulose binding domain-containing protein [Bacteroidales bacterium]
ADTWINLLDRYGISYAMWNLSNKDESSSIINAGVTKTSGFDYDDLSASGKWLYDTLQAARNGTSLEDATAGPEEETGEEQQADTTTQNGIGIDPVLDSSWEEDDGTYYLYRAAVTNTGGSAVTSWSVTLDFSEEIRVSDFWNCDCTADGTTLTVSSAGYNGELNAGETAEDIGFIIVGTGALALDNK